MNFAQNEFQCRPGAKTTPYPTDKQKPKALNPALKTTPHGTNP
jgi:hypothetical protein